MSEFRATPYCAAPVLSDPWVLLTMDHTLTPPMTEVVIISINKGPGLSEFCLFYKHARSPETVWIVGIPQ
jgi:hypothetical protein